MAPPCGMPMTVRPGCEQLHLSFNYITYLEYLIEQDTDTVHIPCVRIKARHSQRRLDQRPR